MRHPHDEGRHPRPGGRQHPPAGQHWPQQPWGYQPPPPLPEKTPVGVVILLVVFVVFIGLPLLLVIFGTTGTWPVSLAAVGSL